MLCLGRDDPLEKEMANHSSVPSGKTHGERSLVGYSPESPKESDMTEYVCMHLFTYIKNT